MISYRKLWTLLASRDLKQSYIKDIGLDHNIYGKLRANKYVSMQTLEKIAVNLGVEIGDLVEIVKE